MTETRIALIGAGAIGRAHVMGAAATPGVGICGIADPSPSAQLLAAEFAIPWFADYAALLQQGICDGAIIAVPNALHVPIALDCIAAKLPVLVEKPVADSVAAGRRLSASAASAGIPVLIGHHRRHNPIIKAARQLVRDGALGRIASVSVMAMFLKADAYFDAAWRREPGGGPVLINLIHEIDLLRFVCGEVASVQAVTANAMRGHAVEDTAAVILHFASGALGTIMLSDSAASPWSWDLASGENPGFPQTAVDSHFICGTEASMALPSLTVWRYAGQRGWDQPLATSKPGVTRGDPYAEQMRHFAAVIHRLEQPLTTAEDATRTLAVTLAVKTAAETGTPVMLAQD